MTILRWTREAPRVAGHYWLRDYLRCREYMAFIGEGLVGDKLEVWNLERDDGSDTHGEPLSAFGRDRWEFAGPISRPVE